METDHAPRCRADEQALAATLEAATQMGCINNVNKQAVTRFKNRSQSRFCSDKTLFWWNAAKDKAPKRFAKLFKN